jgi:TonB-dependent Receptor Plug Domain.
LDADKLPIPGVNVVIKGTSIGTITDLNGLYNLTVSDPEQSVLVFSFIGFDTQEIKVGNKTVIHVVLASTAISLEEVVAIGYGTAKRKDLTGSVSSIKAGDVEKVPVANIAQALSGKVAGVQVNQASGSPDADIRILVRGGTSITQAMNHFTSLMVFRPRMV